MFLGFLQGLTEFLPISSSGHLVLFRNILGLGDISSSFDIFLHLGTALAVVIFLHKEVWEYAKSPRKIGLLIIATIPAGITGLLLKDKIEEVFYGGSWLFITFFATACILFACQVIEKRREKKQIPLSDIKWENALSMGVMQACALLPGLSRSGLTIFGGVASGAQRKQVAVMSFIMSLPVIFGSALLSIGSIDVEWYILLSGLVTAFIGGLVAIKIMMSVIEKANYKWFCLYLVVISIVSFFVT